MTMALCLKCGDFKFGALVECAHCKGAATGDAELDIAFSDWHCSPETLELFGDVIRKINVHSTDPETRFWAFIQYVSVNHPSVLHVALKPEVQYVVDGVLSQCDFSKIKQSNEKLDPDDSDQLPAPPDLSF
jgi:hypothetical protein